MQNWLADQIFRRKKARDRVRFWAHRNVRKCRGY
jgi:hypothetical protein